MSNAPQPDPAADACNPRRTAGRAPGNPRKRRRTGHPSLWLGRWVAKLAVMGEALVRECRVIARWEHTAGRPSSVDMPRAWDLTSRAVCWTNALRLRLRAQRRAPMRAMPDRAENADEMRASVRRAMALAMMQPAEKEMREALRHGRVEAMTEIAGLPTAEVVTQICADLTEAAELLHLPQAKEWVAKIRGRLQTVLDEVGEAADAPPLPPEDPYEVLARLTVEFNALAAELSKLLPDCDLGLQDGPPLLDAGGVADSG